MGCVPPEHHPLPKFAPVGPGGTNFSETNLEARQSIIIGLVVRTRSEASFHFLMSTGCLKLLMQPEFLNSG